MVEAKDLKDNENYDRLLLNREYSLLRQLDDSIDFSRFEMDEEYRRLTIVGLFMCDTPSFDSAEQLAMKYNLSIDHCHHSYLEHLLTNSSFTLTEIRQRLKPLLNSERLKKNRQVKLELVKRLHSNVWPLIDGKDLPRLKLFYELKKALGDLTHAQKHLQVLQELPQHIGQSQIFFVVERWERSFEMFRFRLQRVSLFSSVVLGETWH